MGIGSVVGTAAAGPVGGAIGGAVEGAVTGGGGDAGIALRHAVMQVLKKTFAPDPDPNEKPDISSVEKGAKQATAGLIAATVVAEMKF
jgi:hypothetical protein